MVDTFGTGKIDDDKIAEKVCGARRPPPGGDHDRFKLRRPIYRKLAAYGHMGREDLKAPWENLDIVPELAELLK